MTFAERIKDHRSRTGATQEQLAVTLGVSRSRVAQMEGGDLPSLAVLVRAEVLFGVDLGDLVRESRLAVEATPAA